MPQGLDFFLDPCFVISRNKACRLNNAHTGLKGYGLEMTWCHINNCKELSNAHSSLVDCKAQTDVVLHQEFVAFIDKHSSIVPLNEVWSTKRNKFLFLFSSTQARSTPCQAKTGPTLVSVTSYWKWQACLINGVGRVLYTDNFYTSMKLMEHCYSRYGYLMVGTHALTTKLSRTARDFPFHKPSNAALRLVERGWTRRATQQLD